MSRADARASFTLSQYKKEMQGIYPTSISRGTLDESPMAYKPMEAILAQIGPTVEVTGQAVVCTKERSQYANKQKALARLEALITQENRRKKAEDRNGSWRRHTSLKRGEAGIRFEGMEFRLMSRPGQDTVE